jgi:hypothetical protein
MLLRMSVRWESSTVISMEMNVMRNFIRCLEHGVILGCVGGHRALK